MDNTAIYLTGPDGCGKTAHLEEIKRYLEEQGINYKHIWLRSPKILSKPLMLICRLVGLTKYINIEGVRYGKHEFYRSRIVSWLFPVLQLIDFKLKWYLLRQKLKKDEIVIFDRFAIDTLADLMSDTHRWDLHTTATGRKMLRLIPDPCKIIMLRADESVIISRKKDTLFDEQLSSKIKAFDILGKHLDLAEVDNNSDFKIAREEVIKHIVR